MKRMILTTGLIALFAIAAPSHAGQFGVTEFYTGNTNFYTFDPMTPDRAADTPEVEIPLMPGWPKSVSTSAYFKDTCGLVLANIDDDPDQEVIFASSGEQLHAWDYDGTLLFTRSLTGLSQTVPAVGNVTGDDKPEIVVATREASGGSPTPTLHVFSNTGTLLFAQPLTHTGSLDQPPTLENLDGDDYLEIIVGERGDGEGWLHALNGDLTSIGSNWPVNLNHVPATSAATGDIDNDGQIEVVVCSFTSLYAMEKDGSIMPGFPVTFVDENYSYGSPALADLDGDGNLEILTTTHGLLNRVHAIQSDGSELAGWPFDLGDAWTFSAPSVGDMNGDGNLEVVAGRSGGSIIDDALFVINHDGTTFAPFPYQMQGSAEGSFVLADITGDSDLEIIFTDNILKEDKGTLLAVDTQGHLLPGWPIDVAGMTYLNGATLGDVNNDGVPEIAVVGTDSANHALVSIYSYDGYFFGEGGVHWKTYQADIRHTGLYNPESDGTGDDDDDDDTGDDDDDNDDNNDDDAGDDDDDNDDDDGCGC